MPEATFESPAQKIHAGSTNLETARRGCERAVLVAEFQNLAGIFSFGNEGADGPKKVSSSAGQPTAAPSGIDEIAGEAISALQLYQVRGVLSS
jgi:hypothetical protein